MSLGIKHLIECHCTLAIYKKGINTIYHKFPVYSKINDINKIIPKLAKCNNCEALHYVHEVCKSEIRAGKDDSSIVISKEDIAANISERLSNILYQYDADISSWEHAQDIVEEKMWGETLVLKREVIDEKQQVKILTIMSENKLQISTQTINNLL